MKMTLNKVFNTVKYVTGYFVLEKNTLIDNNQKSIIIFKQIKFSII